RGEGGSQGIGHLRHRRRVVPEVRIGRAVRQPEQLLHVDDLSRRVRRGRLNLVHEVVVANSVLNDHPSTTDLFGNTRAHLVRVRIGVGVALHRGNGDVGSTDLLSHIAVLVLRGDDGDRPRLHRRRSWAACTEEEGRPPPSVRGGEPVRSQSNTPTLHETELYITL